MVQRHGRGRLCFCIARALGREMVEKLTGRTSCRSVDGYLPGAQTILIAACRRLSDPVSYAAGLTSLRFWPFMLATGVGQLPATIVYSWAEPADRRRLLAGHRPFAVLALAVVISIAKNIYRERRKRSSP